MFTTGGFIDGDVRQLFHNEASIKFTVYEKGGTLESPTSIGLDDGTE